MKCINFSILPAILLVLGEQVGVMGNEPPFPKWHLFTGRTTKNSWPYDTAFSVSFNISPVADVFTVKFRSADKDRVQRVRDVAYTSTVLEFTVELHGADKEFVPRMRDVTSTNTLIGFTVGHEDNGNYVLYALNVDFGFDFVNRHENNTIFFYRPLTDEVVFGNSEYNMTLHRCTHSFDEPFPCLNAGQ